MICQPCHAEQQASRPTPPSLLTVAQARVANGRGRCARACRESHGVPYVYLLKCADDSLYCGWTTDLSRRLAAHQAGTASRYTRSRLPVEVAKVFAVADRPAALRHEARIKRLSRAAKLSLVQDTR
jgi:putative endonuclease